MASREQVVDILLYKLKVKREVSEVERTIVQKVIELGFTGEKFHILLDKFEEAIRDQFANDTESIDEYLKDKAHSYPLARQFYGIAGDNLPSITNDIDNTSTDPDEVDNMPTHTPKRAA